MNFLVTSPVRRLSISSFLSRVNFKSRILTVEYQNSCYQVSTARNVHIAPLKSKDSRKNIKRFKEENNNIPAMPKNQNIFHVLINKLLGEGKSAEVQTQLTTTPKTLAKRTLSQYNCFFLLICWFQTELNLVFLYIFQRNCSFCAADVVYGCC